MKNVPVTKNNQSGFTLVELAIVMIIIGLLIGGVLKGEELIRNARLTAVMQQIHPQEVALASFRSLYDALPGDFTDVARLPDCTGDCVTTSANSNGDGWIGGVSTNAIGSAFFTGINSYGYELGTYWPQLAAAGLTEDVSAEGAANGSPAGWGVTAPATKIQGTGLNIIQMEAPPTGNWQAVRGIHLLLVRQYIRGWNNWGYSGDADALSAAQAHQIDIKMDDGRPLSGRVRGFSVTGGAADGCPGPDGLTYMDTSTHRNCNMLFTISN